MRCGNALNERGEIAGVFGAGGTLAVLGLADEILQQVCARCRGCRGRRGRTEFREFFEDWGGAIDAVGMKIVQFAKSQGGAREVEARLQALHGVFEIIDIDSNGPQRRGLGRRGSIAAAAEIADDEDTKWLVGIHGDGGPVRRRRLHRFERSFGMGNWAFWV